MAMVAIFDIGSQFYWIQRKIENYYQDNTVCLNSMVWYYIIATGNILYWISVVFSRCSTWLSLSLAIIRTLVIRNSMNTNYEKLSKPKSALICLLLIILMTLPLIILGYFELETVYNGVFPCDGPEGSYDYYYSGSTDFFIKKKMLVTKIYNALDGVISKFIPCLLYPIATFFLIKELRKAAKLRENLSSTTQNQNSGKTNKLILYLTITFFIGGFPLGVISIAITLTANISGGTGQVITFFTYYFYHLFSLILSLTTCTHMVICFLMSVQYREAAKSMLCCGSFGWTGRDKKTTDKPSFLSIAPTSSIGSTLTAVS